MKKNSLTIDIPDREEHFFVESSMERKQNGYEVLEKEGSDFSIKVT